MFARLIVLEIKQRLIFSIYLRDRERYIAGAIIKICGAHRINFEFNFKRARREEEGRPKIFIRRKVYFPVCA